MKPRDETRRDEMWDAAAPLTLFFLVSYTEKKGRESGSREEAGTHKEPHSRPIVDPSPSPCCCSRSTLGTSVIASLSMRTSLNVHAAFATERSNDASPPTQPIPVVSTLGHPSIFIYPSIHPSNCLVLQLSLFLFLSLSSNFNFLTVYSRFFFVSYFFCYFINFIRQIDQLCKRPV